MSPTCTNIVSGVVLRDRAPHYLSTIGDHKLRPRQLHTVPRSSAANDLFTGLEVKGKLMIYERVLGAF